MSVEECMVKFGYWNWFHIFSWYVDLVMLVRCTTLVIGKLYVCFDHLSTFHSSCSNNSEQYSIPEVFPRDMAHHFHQFFAFIKSTAANRFFAENFRVHSKWKSFLIYAGQKRIGEFTVFWQKLISLMNQSNKSIESRDRSMSCASLEPVSISANQS